MGLSWPLRNPGIISSAGGTEKDGAPDKRVGQTVKTMDALSPQGVKIIEYLAEKHHVSSGTVMTLLDALVKGRGTMAQFNHPELGGLGQWSQGGMTMVGDMFNSAMKAKVDGLCSELSDLLIREDSSFRAAGSSQGESALETGGAEEFSLFVHAHGGLSARWWGIEMGVPTATGAQNDINYAYFRAAKRLAIKIGDQLSIYDTGHHEISGISQQQGGDASLTFRSQHGLVRLAELHLLPADSDELKAESRTPTLGHAHDERADTEETGKRTDTVPPAARPADAADVFVKLERLADLNTKGIVSDAEFEAKKRDLLDRL
jgi:hypothetical protein